MMKNFYLILALIAAFAGCNPIPAIADTYTYGSTPQLDIPKTGTGGWGPAIEQAYKDLTDFTAIYANPDGTLKATTTATPWQQVTSSVTYVSSTQFKVADTYESYFETGRRVSINQAADVIGAVASISTAGGFTTVTLESIVLYSDNSTPSTLTNPITSVSVSMTTPRSSPATGIAGEVRSFAMATPPSGWLECNGAAVSRTTYAALFAAIGITHGQGDGSTTFNIPDYRGRFLRGWDHGASRDPDKASRAAMATGGNTGDNVGSVQTDQYKTHTHTQSAAATSHWTDNTGAYRMAESGTVATGSSGGNETRPLNANVMFAIKY